MSEFNAILLEGLFYLGDQPLVDAHDVADDSARDLLLKEVSGPPVNVRERLLPFVGKKVRVAAHHLPTDPTASPPKWGLGSCVWQAMGGECPYGHNEHNPMDLFSISEEGVLVFDLDHSKRSGGWWLEKFDGTRMMLPLLWALNGHHGRIAAATALSIEDMRDTVTKAGVDSVEGLNAQAQGLQDLLGRLAKTVRED